MLDAYNKGFDIGAIMPCLSNIRGFVASWNVVFVLQSCPIGSLRLLSYCALLSNGCGSEVARYLPFYQTLSTGSTFSTSR
jgi:hypothetical protein